ncbi:MAG TPA: SDR family NAD(P)-dependent oxidoreductase, partial [Acidimicrobiales bacterium]|nr:SDR family NAD(P)-dependent oxidoreductase [Acidimicrobiales bacterium]
MALLDGKVALVSGVGPGLGRDIALACGRQGATVAVAARTGARIDAIAAEIEGLGAKALALRLDVCDADSCRGTVEQVVDTFGRLDVLVN